MALGDPYCSVAELKSHLQIADAADDVALTTVADAVSRGIEQFCGRQFNDAGSASARTFYPRSSTEVWVDDFHTTTGLVVKTDSGDDGTFETTLLSADYVLHPLNGIVDGQTGRPYRKIVLRRGTLFPTWSVGPSVEVTARWGWASVPAAVKQAALIQSARVFKRRYSPEGVAGFGEFGVVRVSRQIDPDVQALLAPYQVLALVA